MTVTFFFNYNINESLQPGDQVYYCPNQSLGGFDTVDNEWNSSTGIVLIGNCLKVDRNTNMISVNVSAPPPQDAVIANAITVGDFLMFSKDNEANLSSILGYYAETTFMNDSPEKAELFAVSTEFSESSK
tara:strand:+ start:1215 stop:1604 length:390 start_codon:yes stop_codon:yes gene_type:complete